MFRNKLLNSLQTCSTLIFPILHSLTLAKSLGGLLDTIFCFYFLFMLSHPLPIHQENLSPLHLKYIWNITTFHCLHHCHLCLSRYHFSPESQQYLPNWSLYFHSCWSNSLFSTFQYNEAFKICHILSLLCLKSLIAPHFILSKSCGPIIQNKSF